MNDDIQQLCNLLRLRRIPQILERELKAATKAGTAYSDFLARLLRDEYLAQQEKMTRARIERARIPERWALDSFPWDLQPGVDRKVIREHANLDFVRKGINLVLIGNTGVGKTGLATGLLLCALQGGYRGLFVKAQNLFDEMYASLADHATRRLLDRLIRYDILLVDELGYLNLRPEQTNIFFKLMEDRHAACRATIITTNLDYDDWGRFLGNPLLTGALLSRLRHRCHTLRIDGPSLRTPAATA
ncbi:MAG: ATP-binding protein [Deltaproteobacteria bacterium]|nr:ATP-binding protein [Deltaproteobacteria bacterium]